MYRYLSAAALMLALGAGRLAAADDIDRRLERAEAVKRSQLSEFQAELAAIGAHEAELTRGQREHLDYLRAWQSTFSGDYDSAIASFEALIANADDPTLRFRSRVTQVNALTLARRYPQSFEQLNQVLEELETITDPPARAQALGAAAQLLNQVAQYEESLRYSTRLLDESSSPPWARCGAAQLQYEARVKAGLLTRVDAGLERWAGQCSERGEHVFAGLLRTYIARLHLQQDDHAAAIAALTAHHDEIRGTRYPFLIADVASKLATAHLALRQDALAGASADEAIAITPAGENTESLSTAWQVKYRLAATAGDFQAALTALERHFAIERAWLDDVGQRALAFEMARHQARAKSLEIEALNQQNQLLQLQQQVAQKSVQSARLSILLLLTILVFAVFWALRVRRMKRHFQELAQRDGLTAVSSRAYFIEQGRSLLDQRKRAGEPASLVLLDLDHFKNVNDQFGHGVGDDVLRKVAAACRQELGPGDLFGRLGGEEFALLLPRAASDARALAERCRLAMLRVRFGPGDASSLSGSFGIAETAVSGYDLHQLLIDADLALYQAKNGGRNQVVVFDRRARQRHGEPALA